MAIKNPMNMRGPLRSGGSETTDSPTSPTVISSTGVSTNPTTFLYDVGLQNVYQDYQKSIATLNQQEQQSLQDAYYIREMSKKYLGEYASNVGVGDVSGNLLDIYGKYQQNVAGIRADVGTKELTLQQQYDQARRALETGKMEAELAAQAEGAKAGVVAFSDISSPQTVDLNGNPIANPNYVPNFDITYYNLPEGFNTSTQSVYRDAAGTEYYNVTVDVDTESEDDKSRFYEGATSADLFDEFSRINGEDARPTEGDIIPLNGVNYVLRDGKFYRLQVFDTNQGYKNFVDLADNLESGWSGSNIQQGSKDTTKQGVFKSSNDEDLIYVNMGDDLRYTNASESGAKDSHIFTKDTNIDSEQEVIAEFRRVHPEDVTSRTMEGRITGVKTPSVVEFKGKLYYMNSEGKVWLLRARDSMTNKT